MGILKDLGRFPRDLHEFSIIGIFDGDCRGRMKVQLANYSNYLFLPTNKAPEELLIDYLVNSELSAVAKHLSTTVEELSFAIDVATGSDHHDYFYDLAKTLELSYDMVFSLLCDLWVADPNNQEKVNAFISDLESMVT